MDLITVNASSSISMALYYTKKNRAAMDTSSKQLASGMVFDKAGDGYAAQWLVTDTAYYKQQLAKNAENNLDTGAKVLGNATDAMGSVRDMVQQLQSIVQSMMTKKGDFTGTGGGDINSMKGLANNFFDVMKSMQTQITQASDFNGINMLTSNTGLTVQMDNFSTMKFNGLQFLGTNVQTGGVMEDIKQFMQDHNDMGTNPLQGIEDALNTGGKSYIMVWGKSASAQIQVNVTEFAGANGQYTMLANSVVANASLQDDDPYGVTGTEALHSNFQALSLGAAGGAFTAQSLVATVLADMDSSAAGVSSDKASTIADELQATLGGEIHLQDGVGVFAGMIGTDGAPTDSFWNNLTDLSNALTKVDSKIQGHVATYGIYTNEIKTLETYKGDRADNLQNFADGIKMIDADVTAAAKALAATRLQIAQQVVAFQVSNYGQSIQQISGGGQG